MLMPMHRHSPLETLHGFDSMPSHRRHRIKSVELNPESALLLIKKQPVLQDKIPEKRQ